MPTTIKDILGGVRANGLPATSISTGGIDRRTSQATSVQYYFDILNANISQPIDSQILSIKQRYEGSDDDNYLPYPVENMDDAIDLCRQFCQNIGLAFTAADEAQLRAKTNSERISLLIIERVIYTV